MSEFGAPAKRGESTPVPVDVQTKRFQRAESDVPDDSLIPKNYVEQRAEERRYFAQQPPPTYVPQQHYGPPVQYAPPVRYGPPVQYAPQHPYPRPNPAPGPYALYRAPYVPWQRGQRAAALWGSFIQHTVFAIAAQVFVYGALFLLLGTTSWDGESDVFQGGMPTTLTDFMVWLAKPENLAMSFLLAAVVVAGLGVAAYYSGALWQRSKGLQGRAKAFWLTTITGGSITFAVFAMTSPFTAVLWFLSFVFMGTGGNAAMWGTTFIFMLLGAFINGFICMGFGRMFLSRARPRVDYAKLAAEAEARARAADEQLLSGAGEEDRYRIHGT